MNMLWIGLVTGLVIAVVVVRGRVRPAEKDLGTVSPHWIAEHRSETR
jgi:hypothetical protein